MGAQDRQPGEAIEVDGTPHELAPLAGDWDRMHRIIERLADSDDLEERADLGAELVRAAARYEDVVERSVDPAVADSVPEEDRAALERTRQELRQAMTHVHERTRHVDPRNAHAGDPEGFERDLDEVVRLIEQHLPTERAQVRRAVESMPAEDRAALEDAVTRAARNASEKPDPPRTAVGRALGNLAVRLDHTVEDVANPHHPGAPTIDG